MKDDDFERKCAMRWLSGVTVVLAVVAIAVTGFAYGPGNGRWHRGVHPQCGYEWGGVDGGHEGMTGRGYQGRVAPALGLSQDQIDKMTALRKKYSGQVKALREDLVRQRIEARALFTDPKVSEETIVAKEKEMTAIRDKLRDSLVQLRLEQRSILSAEQLEKLVGFRRGLGIPSGERHFD